MKKSGRPSQVIGRIGTSGSLLRTSRQSDRAAESQRSLEEWRELALKLEQDFKATDANRWALWHGEHDQRNRAIAAEQLAQRYEQALREIGVTDVATDSHEDADALIRALTKVARSALDKNRFERGEA
jgi:hypothetical protein